MSKELYSILLDKMVAGEAAAKVDNVVDGMGILAYWRVHWWYTETTLLRMSDRRNVLTGPTKCKNESHLAAMIETWEKI